MSRNGRLLAFGEQVGFSVELEADIVRASGVPCLLQNGQVGACTIEKSFDPVSGRPDDRVGGAAHAVRITIDRVADEVTDGRVYHADGTPIGNYLNGDNQSCSDISLKKSYQDEELAEDVVHRYAKQIVGAVEHARYNSVTFSEHPTPFKIPNTFEARSGMGPIQDRIRDTRIAIIGIGGTGSYILDLIAKTPVAEIHLLDSDELDWHNFMRAPGAPTAEEIESQHGQRFSKVGYYHAKYASLRKGIFAHAIQVEGSPQFAEFLAAHPIDFAFVCIDQLSDSDSPRQDHVYTTLSEAGVRFIDSGVSITLDDDAVRGSVTTSAHIAGSVEWDAIPNARTQSDHPGYRNVQLPEVNALAATFAVMEWRRRTGQYVSESTSNLHKFRLDKPHLNSLGVATE